MLSRFPVRAATAKLGGVKPDASPAFDSKQDQARWFVTTHWSMVLAAGGATNADAAGALERLCATYWYPLYSFLRRKGRSPHDAQDLTQSFFAQLLEKNGLQSVDRSKGRFRSFLLASLKNFLANEWDKQHALKRGAGI